MIEIDDYIPARRYLAPRTSSLWRWDHPAAEAVIWTEWGTIAFRQELLAVLQRLAKRGLPPMNPLVWLLGACRESWTETANNLVSRAGMLASVDRCDLPDWLPQLMVELDAVHRLPADLRTMAAAKAELAAMVFEESRPEVGPEDAERIVHILGRLPASPGWWPRSPAATTASPTWLAELRLLHEGLKKFDPAAFQHAVPDGLGTTARAGRPRSRPGAGRAGAAVDRRACRTTRSWAGWPALPGT